MQVRLGLLFASKLVKFELLPLTTFKLVNELSLHHNRVKAVLLLTSKLVKEFEEHLRSVKAVF